MSVTQSPAPRAAAVLGLSAAAVGAPAISMLRLSPRLRRPCCAPGSWVCLPLAFKPAFSHLVLARIMESGLCSSSASCCSASRSSASQSPARAVAAASCGSAPDPSSALLCCAISGIEEPRRIAAGARAALALGLSGLPRDGTALGRQMGWACSTRVGCGLPSEDEEVLWELLSLLVTKEATAVGLFLALGLAASHRTSDALAVGDNSQSSTGCRTIGALAPARARKGKYSAPLG